MEVITGTVNRIIFRNDENCFTVFLLEANEHTICVVGTYFKISENEYLKIHGDYIKHPTYGKQFQTEHYESIFPENVAVLAEYLGNGVIKGIGKVRAKNIVEKFGINTMDVLINHPYRLEEVSGIGKRSASLIGKRIEERTKAQNAMLKLCNFGISSGIAKKLYVRYGEKIFHILQTNPYKLVKEVRGIGFQTIDKIAQYNGIPKEHTFRLESGINYAMDLIRMEGHVCYPLNKLIKEAEKILDSKKVSSTIDDMVHKEKLVKIRRTHIDFIYIPRIYEEEIASINMLHALNKKKNISDKKIRQAIKKLSNNLDEIQTNAVHVAAKSGIMILTGGPGTGKTTTTNLIIRYFKTQKKKVLLAAPTGRAAKRMSEATGMPASTIHRLLEFTSENGNTYFAKNKDTPLKTDVVIIDEVSMLDQSLLYALLCALKTGTQLILVGDKNQLPSVGAGNVLSDLIASKRYPVVELTRIYRQAANSDIIKNAHNILNNKGITLSNKDFFFKECTDIDELHSLLVHYVKDSLPAFTGIEKIQVLTPLRVRAAGANTINELLQDALNPSVKEVKGFRINDQVIQIRNNYSKIRYKPKVKREIGVFNGDTGKITAINEEEELLTVQFDDGWYSDYEYDELNELELSYALTIHKAQGSEYPVVVIPIWDYIPIITTMNLLYTGITRAKRFILIIGSAKRMEQIAKNYSQNIRYTGLNDSIKKED